MKKLTILLQCQIWVYGNSFESFLVGVVVPERQALEDWALLNNVPGNFEELCNYPKAKNYVLEEINNTGRKFGVCIHYEVILLNPMSMGTFPLCSCKNLKI
jgi:long-subunit acyl-CoA synthetase (AMP-forming)